MSDIQPKPPNTAPRYIPKFDQPVILKQPRKWSRAILWSLMAVTIGTVIWANLALIEEAVSATGKLEASSATLDVQAPVGGVVKQIFVIDGKQVHLGERLLTLDNTTSIAQMQSLQKIRASLVQENQFYQSELKGSTSVDVTKLKIPTEILDLTRSRATLIAENQVYRTQLDGSSSASKLTLEQRERVSSNQVELSARVAAATSQIDQLKRQFQQTDIKLVSTEVFYREAKGWLGLKEYQVRDKKSLMRHFILVFCAYTFILWHQLTGGLRRRWAPLYMSRMPSGVLLLSVQRVAVKLSP